MKVLHVIPSISPRRGGPSKAVIEMVKALRTERIDARIVTTADSGVYRQQNLELGKWIDHKTVPVLVHPCIDSANKMISVSLLSSNDNMAHNECAQV